MNGSDVFRARQALGWNRPQMSEATGFSVAQIARMERTGPKPDEEPKLKEVFKLELGNVVLKGTNEAPNAKPLPPPPPALADPNDPDAEITLDTWCGLTKGDVVKVDGDAKRNRRYTFLRYVRKGQAQEYVELKGVKSASGRSIRPDLVLVQRKGKWLKAMEVKT